MRIQHNIMAMSAYRNYTNNVSAMKKNLEKLSSGYKINRAGDDAAGLAISEKMRAQITGLETAQKNAKDGISLVQTAEGALTEVHDMLNRMVELATMSANGTYDNTTDRAQLQKEMDQLRSEIDRIADSSNFNGIKLLDGSMDAGGGTIQTDVKILPTDATGQYGTIGDETVLKKGGAAAKGTVFGVQFDNLAIDAKAGDTLDVEIGGDKVTITLAEKKYTAADLAAELQKAFTAGAGTIDGQAFTAKVGDDKTSVIFTQTTPPTGADDTVEASMDVKMTFTPNGGTAAALDDNIQTFEGETEVTVSGPDSKTVNFTDGDADADNSGASATNATADFNLAGFSVDGPGTVTFTVGGKTYDVEITQDEIDAKGTKGLDEVATEKLVAAMNKDKITDEDAGDFTAAQDGSTKTKITLTSANKVPMKSSDAIKTDIAVAVKKTGGDGDGNGGNKTETVASANLDDGGIDFGDQKTKLNTGDIAKLQAEIDKLGSGDTQGHVMVNQEVEVDLSTALEGLKDDGSETAKDVMQAIANAAKKAADAWNAANGDDKGYTYTNVRVSLSATGDPDNDVAAQAAGNGYYILMDKTPKAGGTSGAVAGVSGSYNAATVKIDQGNAEVSDQRASTAIDLGDIFGSDIGDGSTLTIGENTYTFKWGSQNSFDAAKGTITLDKSLSGAEHINYAAKAMTQMDNSAFSIGNEETTGKLTIDEKAGNTKYAEELKDHKKFEALFSATKVKATDDTKGLKLQIGDTADDYNQLKVSIGDTHCDALGLDTISIANQEDAADAIKAIKTAINTVSDIRGTLGATQNRLDHTINNLSVMTENIQDAESTIRDVDVAEEMMAYTKNNILIQSAQAMLAQANQVPQGVLQLLQ